jgi:glycosyltransferase involved in cell wall biosynthesis
MTNINQLTDFMERHGSLPTITIGVTCFNAETTIERALRSAVLQKWSNKEIIVIDDASTDESLAVINSLAAEYSEIRVIRHEVNKGYPGALNTILKSANGEFIAFFDDDDESCIDRLQLQWQRIVEYEKNHLTDIVFCYSNRDVVPVGQEKPTQITNAIGRNAPEPHGDSVSDFLLTLVESDPYVWGQFGSCTLMVRRSTLELLNGFDEKFRRCAEWDMAIRAGFMQGHFIAVDQSLITQYLTSGVGSEKSGKAPLRYALALRYKHRPYLVKQGIYWSALAQARARFHYSRNERWLHRLFTGLACLFAPRRLLPHILAQRTRLRKNVDLRQR